ncbi:inner centromere protein-like [Contarinia nasturtii]|uniref:inner centromere protein-like n=1 Tax=Contarinia nasturtii TaxID=265458 RepID=UPI0012D4BE2F|nr:inner centromere protein-like [Contarinia nasturtii]
MESFPNDIHAILKELSQSEQGQDELISSFKKGIDDVIQKYVLSKSTPVKPSKKKAKGRVEKVDSQEDSFSSTNSSRTTALNGHQSGEDEPLLMRPVRTGRAKQPTSYKEPPLNVKMRRDGTMTVVNVKVERMSTDAKAEESRATLTATTANESVRPVRIKKEKIDGTSVSKLDKTSRSETNVTKKKSNDSNDSLEIVPMETNPTIELSDDENGNDGNKMPPPAFVPPIKPTKEKKPPAEKKIRSTRSKQPKRKIKQEPVSESEDEATPSTSNVANVASTSSTVSEEKSVRPSRNAADKSKANRVLNTSGESLYEDAMSQPTTNTTTAQPLSQQCDATFVTTVDDTEKEQLSPRGTYIIPKGTGDTNGPNGTFNVEQTATTSNRVVNNQTIVVGSKATTGAKVSGSSLMTEDDSDSDSGVRKYGKKDAKDQGSKKNAKEQGLFVPIKQRVETFEKLQTPLKETRTRARAVESDRSKMAHGSLFSKNTPSEQAGKHARANSATRGAQIIKPALTKSQSVEEIRKKTIAAAASEKKKNQDDKLRKAAQAREAQDREKAEKQRKLLLEKEMRAKEKAQQKQMEEMQKQQEQKRREAEREKKRLEIQMAKKAAADKKEHEHYLKVLAEKKIMQEKLKQNKLQAEEQRKKNPYNFDMLDSGDSTDDEGKTSNKRPLPPPWSTSNNRYGYVMAQARVSTKVTDKFFSVAPHEVDLREIFPKIDEKHLRRNSSAVWNSPPRYSLLPKY